MTSCAAKIKCNNLKQSKRAKGDDKENEKEAGSTFVVGFFVAHNERKFVLAILCVQQ